MARCPPFLDLRDDLEDPRPQVGVITTNKSENHAASVKRRDVSPALEPSHLNRTWTRRTLSRSNVYDNSKGLSP